MSLDHHDEHIAGSAKANLKMRRQILNPQAAPVLESMQYTAGDQQS